MVTKTSLSAIRALMYVARHGEEGCLSPRRIAERLNESPTYMAKVTRQLVRARIFRVEKGVKGGVRLGRPASEVTLLAVVEACQGALVGDYCVTGCDLSSVCSYHRAAAELQGAIGSVLSRWTIEHLLEQPAPSMRMAGTKLPCAVLNGISPAIFDPVKDE